MSGTKHLHHHWERKVTSTEYVPTEEVNMWSRPVHGRSVICHAEYVCKDCGKIVDDLGCSCDTEEGEQCAIRLECLEHAKPAQSS